MSSSTSLIRETPHYVASMCWLFIPPWPKRQSRFVIFLNFCPQIKTNQNNPIPLYQNDPHRVQLEVIGLGAMGMGVGVASAGRLPTHACDMRPEVLSLFESEGGVSCADAAELGAACEVIVILVVNADQTDAVLFGERRCGLDPPSRQRCS